MEKKQVVVFDFDGTLTKKDTLVEFIKFACGKKRLYWGFLIHAPLLALMFMHLYPNYKTKQIIFSYFFKGWNYRLFAEKGRLFANIISTFQREEVVKIMNVHIAKGHRVYIVTASIEEWVRPWCERMAVSNIIATTIEVNTEGKITGAFLSKNCYGIEKVKRLLEVEPSRNDYILTVYGDSRGDKELFAMADNRVWI